MDPNNDGEQIISTSRLRTILNVDCLGKLFEYLPEKDLTTIGLMDSFYVGIINTDVIPKKTLLLSNFTNISDTFRMYGKRFKKLRCDGYGANYVNKIYENCSMTQFKVVTIYLQDKIKYDVNRLMDYFQCVEKAIICVEYCYTATERQKGNRYVRMLLEKSPKLERLTIARAKIERATLNLMLNLTELNLHYVSVDLDDLIGFFRQRPKLQKFVNSMSLDTETTARFGQALAKYCGENIREFGDMPIDIDVELNGDYPEEEEEELVITYFFTRYEFLADFKNLEAVTLTSVRRCASDLHNTLVQLSKLKKLKKMTIYLVEESAMAYDEDGSLQISFSEIEAEYAKNEIPNGFTSLDTIDIHLMGEPTYSAASRFLEAFIKRSKQVLHNVETLNLWVPAWIYCQASDLVRSMPKLRRLSIGCICTLTPHDFIPDLLNIFKRRRNQINGRDSIELIMNNSCNRVWDHNCNGFVPQMVSKTLIFDESLGLAYERFENDHKYQNIQHDVHPGTYDPRFFWYYKCFNSNSTTDGEIRERLG